MHTTITNSEDIFNQAYSDGKRGNALLEVALKLSDLPAECLLWVLTNEFPEDNARDNDPFAWIATVKKFGASKEIIMDLVSQVLFYDSYPNDYDGATQKCAAFVRYAERHLEFVSETTLTKVLNRLVMHSPEHILKHFATISWMLAECGKALGIEVNGEEAAAPYLRRASDEARVIYTMAEVEAILRLPRDTRKRVVKRLVPESWSKAAVVPPIRNLATMYLVIQALVSYGPDDYLESALISSLTWEPSDPKHHDPERPVRIFRWCLKYLAEVPASGDTLGSRWRTPEGTRRLITEVIVDKCRKALETKGFSFTHTFLGSDPQGKTRVEARITGQRGERVYIHDTHGQRQEHFTSGSEVIVPNFVRGEPLFRRRDTIGWRLELHPVAPPSSAMEKRAWDNGGNF